MVFDQDQGAVRRLAPIGHVAFGRTQLDKTGNLVAQAGAIGQRRFIGCAGFTLAYRNQGIQRPLAQRGTDDAEQLDCQRGMSIGETRLRGGGEGPALGRAANTTGFTAGDDKAFFGETGQLLAGGLTGGAELGA